MGTAFIAGCSGDEGSMTQQPEFRTWTVTAEVSGSSVDIPDDEDAMRAIFYGGNNGKRFAFLWDQGDAVKAYKGETELGTLTPTVYGYEGTTLSGSLTGSIAANDVLTLYMPARAYDYTGQDGTLASVSSKYAYQQTTTTVTEAKASGSTLTLGASRLDHAQGYAWFRLVDETGVRVHPTKMQIFAASGKMVKTKAADGTTTYFTNDDPLTIDFSKYEDDGEFPNEAFVAIRNESGAADTYTFRIWVGGKVFEGPTDKTMSYNLTYGKMVSFKRAVSMVLSAVSSASINNWDGQPTVNGSVTDD